MDGGMTKWYKAAQKRYSVRRYKQEPSLEDMLALESAAASLSVRGVRIAVGVEQKVFSGILGSRIKGTSAFAAFISQNGDETSLGYLGEAFVLECTSLGLGTCWLGSPVQLVFFNGNELVRRGLALRAECRRLAAFVNVTANGATVFHIGLPPDKRIHCFLVQQPMLYLV